MRVTSKGQVTIPKDIRVRLGIIPGSEVDLRVKEGKIVLINRENVHDKNQGAVLVQQLKELGERARREGFTSGLTTDEIMEITRGPHPV